eukprot:m.267599 g.267599  ORF g.267599 m.267599 type:complete len:1069 (-) comp22804_c7_seq3:147-3353(-)
MTEDIDDAHNLFQEQMEEVRSLLKGEGVFDAQLVERELTNFYETLGLPHHYFRENSAKDVAKHIKSLQAARIMAETSGHPFDINLRQEDQTSAMFATRSFVSDQQGGARRRELSSDLAGPIAKIESQIEAAYLSGGVEPQEDQESSSISASLRAFQPPDSLSFQQAPAARASVYRLQAFRSRGVLDGGQSGNAEGSGVHLRLYFLHAPEFANPKPKPGETSLDQLGDVNFLKSTSPAIREVYQRVMAKAVGTLCPVIEVVDNITQQPKGREETMVMVAHHIGSTHSYFTGIPDVYRFYYFYATRKYVEPFSNGVVIFVFFLRSIDEVVNKEGRAAKPMESREVRLQHVADGISLHYVLPRTSLTPLLRVGKLNAEQVAYAYAAWKFSYHFLKRNTREFKQLAHTLSANPEGLSLLSKLRTALKAQSFTEGAILDSICCNLEAVTWMYEDFVTRHMPASMVPSLRRRRYDSEVAPSDSPSGPRSEEECIHWLRRNCSTEIDRTIFTAFFEFNRHILKTNFFKPGKIALSFRLDPSFLTDDYDEKPFGVFFVLGSEFRGFHVRFHDVARGGIRLVRSRFAQDYAQNLATVFDECYNLSNTQQRKNKDIPEGGSKGIILLHHSHQEKGRVAFQKFVDSLLDLLLPDEQYVVDHSERKEILFLGPDEGTADLMDWASQHARTRGYEYWKAFTTGKSVQFGGIPHDTFGMTTHSVRAYVNGIQRKLGLDGTCCTKVQTGGPDGDLGSNEIKQGNEKTIAVVDGSGVLYDPEGIDKECLLALANKRQPIQHFDKSKISAQGYMVLVDDRDVTLPDGTQVENGMIFRNLYHLQPQLRADFFVPCGGRPAAVDGSNVLDFLYGAGAAQDGTVKPRFKYVVEGANLFFTQDARLRLEQAGIVVFKDASANKGGVTSSSLEVLAALALSNDEFKQHMTVLDAANPPPFYKEYVAEVQARIANNADSEFECLWREHQHSKEPLSILSNKLSIKITDLSSSIEQSDSLWENLPLRTQVLKKAVPQTLQRTIGFDTIVDRLPSTYARALFASHVASRFIYEYGLHTPEFAFYEWVAKYVKA